MPEVDSSLKVIKPNVGGGRVSGSGEKLTSSFDLVEEMHYLFLRVVKARDLACNTAGGTRYPFVEIKIGNYKGTTKYFESSKPNPECNQVFAFAKDRIQSLSVEITVREKGSVNDEFIGKIVFKMSDIPIRVPPDSSLAPQWHKLEDNNMANGSSVGELMLVIWFGTEAHEAFPDAWHSDVAAVSGDSIMNTLSKVYLSPRLWYLRVNIIEAQNLVLPSEWNRITDFYVHGSYRKLILYYN